MENLERAYALDIKIRIADEKLPPEGIATSVTEYDRTAWSTRRTASRSSPSRSIMVDVIKPAYGYRIEYGGARGCDLRRHALQPERHQYGTGADLLVHEVAAAPPELMKEAFVQRIIGHHVTPREARHGVRADKTQACRLHARQSSWPAIASRLRPSTKCWLRPADL